MSELLSMRLRALNAKGECPCTPEIKTAELLESACSNALYPLTESVDVLVSSHTIRGDCNTMDGDIREEYQGLLKLIAEIKAAIGQKSAEK